MQEPIGHMQPIVRIDADEMFIERGMMNFGKRYAVRNNRLAKPNFTIGNDVRGI